MSLKGAGRRLTREREGSDVLSAARLHRGHRRAESNMVGVAILIVITIVLGLVIYFMAGKFMHTGTTVTATAQLVQSSYVNGGSQQDLLFSINTVSQTRVPLTLKYVNVIITFADGTVTTANISTASPGVTATASSATATMVLGGSAQVTLNPGGSETFDVAITTPTSSAIASVAFQLVFQTPAGNTITVTTNSVQVSS